LCDRDAQRDRDAHRGSKDGVSDCLPCHDYKARP
jgi:hypothetical protein